MWMYLPVVCCCGCCCCWVGGFSLEHIKQIARVLGFTFELQRQTHAETERSKLDLWIAEWGRCSTSKHRPANRKQACHEPRPWPPESGRAAVSVCLSECVSIFLQLCVHVFDVAAVVLNSSLSVAWICMRVPDKILIKSDTSLSLNQNQSVHHAHPLFFFLKRPPLHFISSLSSFLPFPYCPMMKNYVFTGVSQCRCCPCLSGNCILSFPPFCYSYHLSAPLICFQHSRHVFREI